jgi:hypothetical protein
MQPQNPQENQPNQADPNSPAYSASLNTDANAAFKSLNNPLLAMQAGEEVICDVRRHPIGLVTNYAISASILILAALGTFVLIPMYVSADFKTQALEWSLVGLIFLAFFVFVFSYIAAKVYKGNRWIVTSDSITQIRQITLFSKQSSQLSLHNLEDITVDQNGIVQTGLNYGTLRAETAGERSKFSFPYCPNPNECARKILAAREAFMGGGAFQGKVNANDSLPPHDQGPSDPYNNDAGVNIGT